jgi:putative endonuclease
MYFVYILQSRNTGRFYVGQCAHLVERFHEHQRGCNLATRNRGPWWMPYYEVHPSRTEAIKREAEIKRKKSVSSIRAIIAHNLPGLEIS